MNVRVACPNPDCGAVARVDEGSLGRRGRCRKCGHVFALAREAGEAASAISGDRSGWKDGEAPRPPASPTNLPEQFGRYRIMRPLGQGGMGAVYLAHDTKLDRPVALKVPFFHPSDGPEAIRRFEREARAAANLDHPHLCPVYDVGQVGDLHYLTMPFIEGKPLSEMIDGRRPFGEAEAASMVRKLALALADAHAQGVVHRDLKPANIMLNRRRDLVIMDFGLARMADAEEGAPTRTGHVLGTALYMAPEQAAGGLAASAPACDVYSLGVILHELLTGRRPFEGPWSLVIGLKSVKDPDPPSSFQPGLHPSLEAICLKAIARKPDDRHASMAELAEALDRFLADPSTPTSIVTWRTRTRTTLRGIFARIPIAKSFESRVEVSSTPLQLERPEGFRSRNRAWTRRIVAGGTAVLGLGVLAVLLIRNDRGKPGGAGPEPIVDGTKKPMSIPIAPAEAERRWRSRAGATWVGSWAFESPANEDEIWGVVTTVTERAGESITAALTLVNMGRSEIWTSFTATVRGGRIEGTAIGPKAFKLSITADLVGPEIFWKFEGIGQGGDELYGQGRSTYQGPFEPEPQPDPRRLGLPKELVEEGAGRLKLVGFWGYWNGAAKKIIEFMPDGTARLYGWRGTWTSKGNRLTVNWPTSTNEIRAFVDELELNPERTAYTGNNPDWGEITGRRVRGGGRDGMPTVKYDPAPKP